MFFQGNEKYNCATYLRLSRSDGDQQESNSIKNQRALLNDYMGKHPELHKFDEYVDDGYSGTNFERPDFKRMICRCGIFCYMISGLQNQIPKPYSIAFISLTIRVRISCSISLQSKRRR